METLNEYFLFEIRELIDNHINSNEPNRQNTKIEINNFSVYSPARLADALFPKAVVIGNSLDRDVAQIGMTLPKY